VPPEVYAQRAFGASQLMKDWIVDPDDCVDHRQRDPQLSALGSDRAGTLLADGDTFRRTVQRQQAG